MSRILPTVFGIVLGLAAFGCGSGYHKSSPGATPEVSEPGKVKVEAYLFDARLRREGKPTSLRLEFYQTDSMIAIAGRGYLGKGALRGRLTSDSLEVYFPTTDEYLLESVASVMGSIECSGAASALSLMTLFQNLPDSALTDTGLSVVSDYGDKRYPEFRIRSVDCPWQIDLTYARQDKGWRIKKFFFDDGNGASLKGTRRNYKGDAEVKAGRFAVPLKAGSVRIIL